MTAATIPHFRADETAPFKRAAAVTPSDTVDLPYIYARALYIGVGGDVTVITANDDTVTFKNMAAGQFLPGYVTRVKATGTTASSILALR